MRRVPHPPPYLSHYRASLVIASAANQTPSAGHADCFAALLLAMTGKVATDPGYLAFRGMAGKLNRKIAPASFAGSVHMRPLCASMIDRQIDNPIPIP
jgi:hypothetical protein